MDYLDLNITPVEKYSAPEIPTFEDNNTAIVKKLPSRWQKSAKIIAGLGLIGVFALSGCGYSGEYASRGASYATDRQNNITHSLEYSIGSYRGYSDRQLLVRIHTGGFGGSFYMVHLTEHEAFGIIRARLEAAELGFGDTPPEESGLDFSYINTGWSYYRYLVNDRNRVELDLFDAYKNVGISFVNWLGASRAFMPEESELAARLTGHFAEQGGDISVGAFYNPGQYVWNERVAIANIFRRPTRPSSSTVRGTRPILVRQLINQADIFIARLQLDGVLEPFPDINVIINEEPLCIGEIPVLVNNQIMVPARGLFEALGMELLPQENYWRIVATSTKNSEQMQVQVSHLRPGITRIFADRNDIRGGQLSDVPVFVHDDIAYAPLQFVADFIGASIQWDADTRTLTISQ